MTNRFNLSSLAIALSALTFGAAHAATVELDASCTPQMSHMQQRLYSQGNQGGDVLRNFMYIRRQMLQLDIAETGQWVNAVNEARAGCTKELAQAQAERNGATRVAETSTR
jgi:hypothetical protein